MQIISDTQALIDLIDRLKKNTYVTVDTEFMWERTFWPKLCLIQIAGDDESAIIDPLANGIDLTSFYDLLIDTSTLKVMHGCRNDIFIFINEAEIVPMPIFDTQVGAMYCGYGESPSYEQLVRQIAEQDLDKSQRNTNWDRRPLSAAQLRYALDDVTHLREVYLHIVEDLDRRGRLAWVEEEFDMLTETDQYRYHPEQAWQRFNIGSMKPETLGILVEVAAWREKIAQAQDVPRPYIIKDDAIREVARVGPKTQNDFDRVRSLPRNFKNSKLAPTLLEAILRGRTERLKRLPAIPSTLKGTTGSSAYIALLNVVLKYCAEKAEVAAPLIATRDEIKAFVNNQDIRAMRGWRYDTFGQYACALKAGRVAITIDSHQIAVIKRDALQTQQAKTL